MGKNKPKDREYVKIKCFGIQDGKVTIECEKGLEKVLLEIIKSKLSE